MDRKLTLSLNATVIDRAKRYAREHDISLSKMIEHYLASLTKVPAEDEPRTFTPLVSRLLGVVDLPEGDGYKDDYVNRLLGKYA